MNDSDLGMTDYNLSHHSKSSGDSAATCQRSATQIHAVLAGSGSFELIQRLTLALCLAMPTAS